MASRVVKKEVGVSQSLCFVKCVFLTSSLDLILFHSANDSPVCKWYYIGLWRYWIFPYRGDAATNIAVWRLIARFFQAKKNWSGRTCASAWSAAPKRLRAAEPQHIVAGVRFHWSREEMYFQSQRFMGRAYTHCIGTSAKVHAADWAMADLVFKLK